MRKIVLLLLVVLAGPGYFSGAMRVQGAPSQEAITSYASDIIVHADNSIDVTEKVAYDTGAGERHGIRRDIYPFSSQERRMSIEGVSVTDEGGAPYSFKVSDSGNNVRIEIGDPDRTFSGKKSYVIRYHATDAVAQLKDVDEIYWNATGNGWDMPIYQARVSVALPPGVVMVQSACYYGPQRSATQCQSAKEENGLYVFNAPGTLNPREGLTVAVGFPKGAAALYPSSGAAPASSGSYWGWLIGIVVPAAVLVFSFANWRRKGRDWRGTGVIIPQYDVPDGLTPMEVGGIANEKVNAGSISAQIIYLATQGYLQIRRLDERIIGIIKSADYELVRLKDFSDVPNDFDRQLLGSLFDARPRLKLPGARNFPFRGAPTVFDPIPGSLAQSVKLSDLRYAFYQDAAAVVSSVLNALVSKGYYKNLGRMKGVGWGMLVAALLFLGGLFGAVILKGDSIPLVAGTLISLVILAVFSFISPSKTEKGVAAKEYILGLKLYLRIAEKNRLEFHNAPDKRPERFEKLLPYAMVLGVADIWAKEFEGIYTVPPSWYSAPSGTVFGAVAFSNAMNDFSSFTASSLASAPSGGGSGGSGFSGGGGGGGGGSSW